MKKTHLGLLILVGVLLCMLPCAASEADPYPLSTNGSPDVWILPANTSVRDYYSIELKKVSLVSVELRADDPNSLNFSFGLNGMNLMYVQPYEVNLEDGGYVGRFSAYMNAGVNRFTVDIRGLKNEATVVYRGFSTPVDGFGEQEPNGTKDQAQKIMPGQLVRGLVCAGDYDYYAFTLERDSVVEFTARAKDSYLYAGVPLANGSSYSLFAYSKTGKNNPSKTGRVAINKGTHYILVRSGLGQVVNCTGAYAMSMRIIGDPKPIVTFKKSPANQNLAGMRFRSEYDIKPHTMNWYWDDHNITIKSSNEKIVRVNNDGDSYYIEMRRAGTTKLSLYIDGIKRSTHTFKVGENKRLVKKPYVGKENGVYVSHRLINYVDRTIKCEVFVTNKTKQTLYKIANMKGYAFDPDDEGRTIGDVNLPDWTPKTPIKPGRTQVYKFDIPHDKGDDMWNFKLMKYYVSLGGTPIFTRQKQFGQPLGNKLINVMVDE